MKKYIRVIALLLTLVMVAALAVSCKKAPDEDDEEVITDTDDGSEISNTEAGDEDDPADDGQEDVSDGGGSKQTGNNGSSNKKNKGTSRDKADTSADTKTEQKEPGGTGDKKESQGGKAVGEVTEKGGWTEDEEGKVIDTKTSVEFDEETMTYKTAITNDNGWIPDEEQGLEKSARRATEASKYDFDRNPLINRDRQQNKTYMPSFDMDSTGFVRAGTKIEDLKGKTLFFFTSDWFDSWSYRSEKGETIGEHEWFKQLKTELGLNIKYVIKQHMNSINSALQYMNAGKQCDIVYSNHVIFPSSICITKSITDLVNINNLGSSPGVCKRTMDLAKWGNTLRLIAPIGCVDVIWYNQTMTQELNMSDPHLMWEKGKWNWDAFKNYLMSAPKTTKNGTKLCAFVEWPSNCSYIWPSTNGAPRIYIDAEADTPTLVNNWDNPLCIEAWEFICSVHNSIEFANVGGSGQFRNSHLAMYEGGTLMSATMYTQVYRDTEYSKHVQINWVPFPKSPGPEGQEICQYYGFGMMLPKKTAKPDNVNFALKFMELWATRFTETLFDNLNTFEYYNFNYKQRKQYFDFVTSNVVFALAMNDLDGSGINQTNFFNCFYGDAAYNVKTEAAKASNLIQAYVVESLKYGQ